MARSGLEKAKRAMFSGEYDIVVFDEINTANYFNLITTGEMLELIRSKPDGVELAGYTGNVHGIAFDLLRPLGRADANKILPPEPAIMTDI